MRILSVNLRQAATVPMRTLFALLMLTCLLFCAAPSRAAQMGGIEKKYLVTVPPKTLALGDGPTLANPYPHLLIRIEYPAQITSAGIDAFALAAKDANDFNRAVALTEVRARAIDGVNKSAYFALRLYRTLVSSGAFPPNSIALDPVTIDAPDKPGQILSTRHGPVSVPAVLTIRFAVLRNVAIDLTHSEGEMNMLALQNSFADWVTPKFAIFTEPLAWPSTGGMIATVGLAGAPIFSCSDEDCIGRAPEVGDFLTERLTYTMDKTRVPVSMKTVRNTLPYPFEVADKDGVFVCPDTPAAVGPPCPYEQLVLAYARQALRQVDPYMSTRFQWKRYLARFDTRLADRWPGGIDDGASRQRLALIKRIMATERNFITRQSESMASAALDGVPGKTFRGQRQAERDYSATVKKASSAFSLASLLSMATTISQFGQSFAAKDFSGEFTAIQTEMERANKDAAIGQQASSKIADLFSANVLQTLEAAPPSQSVLGKDASAKTLPALQDNLRRIYLAQSLPPLPADAECDRDRADGALQISFGTCHQVAVGTGHEVTGNGYSRQISPTWDMVTEFSGGLQVTFGNWIMESGKLVNLDLYQATTHSNAGANPIAMVVLCYMSWDTSRPAGELWARRCQQRPDLFSDGNGMDKPLTKEGAAALDAQIAQWRAQTLALIREDHAP